MVEKTEKTMGKGKGRAEFFQPGLTVDCMPRSDEERARNSSIAGRLRNILQKRIDSPLGLAPISYLFFNQAIDGHCIAIGSFSSKNEHSEVPKGFVFPLYEIGKNRAFVNRRINSEDRNVYCFSFGYYFNDKGQAVKYLSIDKESDAFYKDVKIRKKLPELKFLPGESNAYIRLEQKDYSEIENWLTSIEAGKCTEHPMNTEKSMPTSTQKFSTK
jgi:hypothetical protein